MPLTRDERKLLHQKSKQPTFGSGKPDKGSGNEGDIAYRKVQGSGTVQYLKQDGDWVALSSSEDKPQTRTQSTTRTIISTSGSVSDHSSLSGLGSDDHTQYVLVNGTRAFSGNWTNAGNTIADLGTVTTANITIGSGKTLDVSAGTLTLSNDQISGDKINGGTIGSVTIGQLSGSLDANSQSITNINIDSGAIDGVTIGANSANTGVFTTLTATTLGGALNVNNENLTNVDIDSGDISGTDIDVTGQTLSLDDNQISGDKVEGGTINAITITGLTTAGITATSDIDIGSFDFRANTLIADDLTSGRVVFSTTNGQLTDDSDFTFATDTLTVTKIAAFTLTGKLTAGSSEIEGSAFDINGGAIDNTVIGANTQAAGDFTAIGAVSAGTIVGTTIDATTDFTVGTTVITDDQIQMSPTNGIFTLSSGTNGASTISTIDSTASNGASLLLQPQGPLIVSSNSQEIKFHDGSNYVFEFDTANVKFKMADDSDTGDFFEIHTDTNGATIIKTIDDDGVNADLTFDIDGNIDFKQTSGTTRYTFNLDSTPKLEVVGEFTLHSTGEIYIDSDSAVIIQERSQEVIKVDTNRDIFFNQYNQSLFKQYGFHNKATKYHFTSGQDDFEENYSMVSSHNEVTTTYTYPTGT